MAWDESEHPRESDGKFTDGAGQSKQEKLEKAKRIYGLDDELVSLPLDFFGKKSFATKIPDVPKDVYSFRNKELLHRPDHLRHVKEMGFSTQKEYEKAAVEFWNSGKGELYYSDKKGGRFIRTSKNRICVVTIDGYIATFFDFQTKKEKLSYEKNDGWRFLK